jgi:membrane associated rhomboid family serine protease
MFPLKHNIPLARLPLVTIALVAINAIAYLLEIRHGGSFLGGPTAGVAVHYGAIPAELTHSVEAGVWKTAITSMFLHASFLQILADMLFLAIFGPPVEDAIGRVRYPLFYLLGGLVALGIQVAVDPSATAPSLGASGAIAAVLGGYVLLHPRGRIVSLVLVPFLVTIVEVPALLLLAVWFVVQAYVEAAGLARVGGIGSGGEVVAYFAHVGSFAFGLLAIRLLLRRPRARPACLGAR